MLFSIWPVASPQACLFYKKHGIKISLYTGGTQLEKRASLGPAAAQEVSSMSMRTSVGIQSQPHTQNTVPSDPAALLGLVINSWKPFPNRTLTFLASYLHSTPTTH